MSTALDIVFLEKWQPVIGLEVHAQLATDTKMFCACRRTYGEALLRRERTRERTVEKAYLVVKVDSEPDQKQLGALVALEGILSVRKVIL